MKKSVLLFSLLSGTAFMYPEFTIASGFPLTHTSTPEPKPAFQFEQPDKAYKTAGVCFLGVGDCGSESNYATGGSGESYDMDTVRQCQNEGFVSSCASGWRPLVGGDCPYNPNYKTCCQSACPANSSPDCTGEDVGEDGCGYTCKKCCSDTCPSGSKNYTGSVASTTECGTTCYNCNSACPSGSSTSYSGTAVGTNECGQSCRKCDSSCPSGYTSSATSECYDTTTNECGNTCYKAKDCDPCPGYYDCGGSWQYCEGSVCSADSSRCSTYCESDHFPYSCGSDYGPCYGDYRNGYCSVSCDKIETDPCAGTSCPSGVSCGSLGCASYSSSTSCCSSVCTSCNQEPDDPCAGVTGLSCGSLGCASYGSCGQCTECNREPEPTDPCDGLTNQSCSYGCQSYYSNCPSKCQTCYADNCHNRTAVISSCPSNASCSYFSDCSSKISSWSCNSGYTKSGSSCTKILSDLCPAGYSKSDGCSCSYGFKATRTEAGSICTKCCTAAQNPNGYQCMKCAY